MRAVLRFVSWVLDQAWRWGSSIVNRVARWARKNWRTVYNWIVRGDGWNVIIGLIRRALGI